MATYAWCERSGNVTFLHLASMIRVILFATFSNTTNQQAINENRSGCFGWALEQAFSGDRAEHDGIRVRPDNDRCLHHHTNKGNFVGKGSVHEPPNKHEGDAAGLPFSTKEGSGTGKIDTGQSFIWLPSMYDLRTHYLKELGFLAAFAQLCGATIFWVGVLCRRDPRKVLSIIRYLALRRSPELIISCLRGFLMGSSGYRKS